MLRCMLFTTGLVFLPCFAAAQDGPSFDCGTAESDAELLVCEDADLAALDRRLTETFAQALAVAEGLDAGAEEAADELRAMQRGWIGGRDECWQAEDLRDCVEGAYLRREAELVGMWMLAEPSSTVLYTCEDGSEVAGMFFDTALPSVRIDYGDSVDVGVLVPAASGARYEASFGSYLWTRGDEAMFSLRGAEATTCTASG
ncbi:MliC family protein [Histidinibacterium lentulum]|uniref:DUF1311 domain-containing protein n=1 Tax=Histidinibacterium lentulum TaxID=2480588 RepID=A0A3N2QM73_9RHOB|nr:MliC family protein [Histidinibacterium lentulum]ROT96296.1 DUF1311 domain-containing protein [Histidinibacterium lentulum]